MRRLNCNEKTKTLEVFERSLGRDFEVSYEFYVHTSFKYA